MKSYSIQNESELIPLIHEIKKDYSDFHIFLLEGELGAGKTTFVKYFVHSFVSHYEVQSPTFTLANIYHFDNLKILHADLYRLKSEEEVLESGLPELLNNCDYAFIEWYDYILPWIDRALIIKISIQNQQRIFHFHIFERNLT